MRILILMSVWSQNLGDELILKNEIADLRKTHGGKTQFDVCSYDPQNPFFSDPLVTYYPYFPMGIKKHPFRNIGYFLRFLWLVWKTDLVIIGGGGIFFDKETGNNPLPQWKFRTNIFRLFRTPYEIYRVSVDISQQKHYSTTKTIFQHARSVIVRDEQSKQFLHTLGISAKKMYDPVFFDTGIFPSENMCLKAIWTKDWNTSILENIDIAGKTVGIAFRSGQLENETLAIEDIIRSITKKWGKIFFLPHSFHELDKKANDAAFLQAFCHHANTAITKNMHETYDVYTQKKIDLCLCMRLHSGILCHVYGIPFVSIEYAKKSKGIAL